MKLPWALFYAASSLVSPSQKPFAGDEHPVDPAIWKALEVHADPVDALLALQPGLAASLAERRMLKVGDVTEWMTEGDKLRLRREGKRFIDITESMGRTPVNQLVKDKPYLPTLNEDRRVLPLFETVSTSHMFDTLRHMTSFYTRFYKSTYGEKSARWLHDHIASIIAESPFKTYISLSWHRHPWPQGSIIARFEPLLTNHSLPVTVLGAHLDSANYLFPLLPAPGADDDGSGSASILEAFRVLASHGYVPSRGPVEFHWYAAEEGGLLGAQQVAASAREVGRKVTAMLQFDLTAYISRQVPEYMGILRTGGDPDLVEWTYNLAKKYIHLPIEYIDLPEEMGGSDHEAWTREGFPSVCASESNPIVNGKQPGHNNPNEHTVKDRMDLDDDKGFFSIDHMARFTELALAFVVEQAGWHTANQDASLQGLWT